MDLRLAGKVALVTGASKGTGLAVTRALVGEGVSVVAAARSLTDDLSRLSTQGRVHPVPVDLGTPDGPARLNDEAVVAYGGLDVLINNVGAPSANRWVPLPQRRQLAVGTDHQLPGRRPHHPRGAKVPARARRRHHRLHLLCQRRPAGPAGHRLQRSQGRPAELLQIALQGGRPARRTRQHGKSGAGRHPALAR